MVLEIKQTIGSDVTYQVEHNIRMYQYRIKVVFEQTFTKIHDVSPQTA